MATQWKFITDNESIKTIDTKRVVYLITCIMAFLVTEFGRFVYRPYIYQHHINDFGIADSVGNLGGIVVQIFFGLTVLNSSLIKGVRLIGIFVAGYILYEALQPILPKGTFDWLDVYGTLIGGMIGLILFLLINILLKQNKVLIRL